MTPKLKAIVTGWIAGLSAFVSWLATVPPSEQNGLLAPIVECLPLTWRPQIGLFMRALATASTIYSLYQASHSSASTPMHK